MEQLALAASSSSVGSVTVAASISGNDRGIARAAAAAGPPASSSHWSKVLLDALSSALSELPDLAELRSFRKAATLRETLWKCLPGIARGLGGFEL